MHPDDRPLMHFEFPLTGWTPWFAWYPVRTWDLRWRWLCLVDRRLMQIKEHLWYPGSRPRWQHRLQDPQ